MQYKMYTNYLAVNCRQWHTVLVAQQDRLMAHSIFMATLYRVGQMWKASMLLTAYSPLFIMAVLFFSPNPLNTTTSNLANVALVAFFIAKVYFIIVGLFAYYRNEVLLKNKTHADRLIIKIAYKLNEVVTIVSNMNPLFGIICLLTLFLLSFQPSIKESTWLADGVTLGILFFLFAAMRNRKVDEVSIVFDCIIADRVNILSGSAPLPSSMKDHWDMQLNSYSKKSRFNSEFDGYTVASYILLKAPHRIEELNWNLIVNESHEHMLMLKQQSPETWNNLGIMNSMPDSNAHDVCILM
jgi:hypothetical protein